MKGEPSAPPRLARSLRLVDLTAIGLNATVGSGIFLLPDDLFRAVGPWSPLAFGLCVLGLFPIAWCFADAARRTRANGGPYEYARQEFGHGVGFSVGWMCFCNAVVSFAAVAAAAAAYAGRLVPALEGEGGRRSIAALAILLFCGLNVVGAKPGAWAVRLFTAGKFAVLLLLVGALFPEWEAARPLASSSTQGTLVHWSSAVFVALFALQGFEVVGVPAGEAEAPERKVPQAVLGTLAITGLLYMLIQTVLVFGVADLGRESDAPLADAALTVAPSLGLVVAVGALVSTLGFVSGSALGTPRYVYALAVNGQLPSLLSRLHPRFQTPHMAILATCLLTLLLVLPLDYRTLIGISNVAVAVQYGATSAAVLRRTSLEHKEAGGRRRALGMVIAAAAMMASGAIWLAADPAELLAAAGALVLGWILRAVLTRRALPAHPRR